MVYEAKYKMRAKLLSKMMNKVKNEIKELLDKDISDERLDMMTGFHNDLLDLYTWN